MLATLWPSVGRALVTFAACGFIFVVAWLESRYTKPARRGDLHVLSTAWTYRILATISAAVVLAAAIYVWFAQGTPLSVLIMSGGLSALTSAVAVETWIMRVSFSSGGFRHFSLWRLLRHGSCRMIPWSDVVDIELKAAEVGLRTNHEKIKVHTMAMRGGHAFVTFLKEMAASREASTETSA